MGAIFNAQANKAPLVITAGNQTRSLITLQANLTNRDATRMPHPLVKFSYEPPRAEDVPHAIARATHIATLPPKGPVFVSIPMDDWAAEVDEDAAGHQLGRVVSGAAAAPGADLADALAEASNPLLVAGPHLDANGASEGAGALAGAGAAPTRPPRGPLDPPIEVELTDPMSASTAMRALAEVFPENGIIVLEAPSATIALRNQLRLSKPGSYYFGAGGGLGFGLAASIGVQMAEPSRPVVCVLGEGSVQYAVSAFWAAAAYKVPVTFMVLRNEEDAILECF